MWVKVVVGDKTIHLTKEEYLKMINEKPDKDFLEECKEVVKLFKEASADEH